MFCPHCGAVLVEQGGALRCQRTGMPLSQRLRQRLTEAFAPGSPAARLGAGKVRLRYPFFCPGCGVQMTPDGCPRCCGVLDELAHDIVELHPHK
jgi:hypothetical protein